MTLFLWRIWSLNLKIINICFIWLSLTSCFAKNCIFISWSKIIIKCAYFYSFLLMLFRRAFVFVIVIKIICKSLLFLCVFFVLFKKVFPFTFKSTDLFIVFLFKILQFIYLYFINHWRRIHSLWNIIRCLIFWHHIYLILFSDIKCRQFNIVFFDLINSFPYISHIVKM